MILSDINSKITSLTGADTDQYTSANRVIDINLWYQKIVSIILDSQDEVDYDDPNQATYPIFKTSLTTNRDYKITTSLNYLKVKDLSVCYDAVNVYKAYPFDINEFDLPILDSANTAANLKMDSNFSRVTPRYDIKFGSVWLYPIATSTDVSGGGYMMIEFFRSPVEFTTSDLSTGTLSPGFDISFHGMIAYGAAFEYASAKQLSQLKVIAQGLADFEQRLRKQYSTKQADRRYALSGDYQSYK